MRTFNLFRVVDFHQGTYMYTVISSLAPCEPHALCLPRTDIWIKQFQLLHSIATKGLYNRYHLENAKFDWDPNEV